MRAESEADSVGRAAPHLSFVALDHVGLVVASLERALARYLTLHGARPRLRRGMEAEGVEVALLEVAGVTLELLEPLSGEGSIARFLAARGEGFHHVAYRVRDLERELEVAQARGLRVVPPGVRPGVTGLPSAFLHPKDTLGVLTELLEGGR